MNFWWIETQQIYGDRHKRQIATSYRTGEDAEPVVMARVTNADGVYGPWRRFAMETDLPKLVSVGSEQNFTLAEKARGRANIDALGSSDRGAANGVASLGSDGKVPSGQLPALTTTATVGAAMAGANSKATPADGDFFAGVQAGGSTMFKTTWANIKTALASVFLRLTGGTLTGFLTLHSAPTANMHAANKGYVDTGLNDKLALSGGTLTGALSGTTISLSGGMSGSLTHRSGGGYMNIGSFNEGTYGSGYCRAWWNENDNILTFTATDGDAIVKSEYFQTTRQPTDVSHLTRKDYVDNLVNARVSNVRRVGPSSVSSITKGGSWDAPSGYFVTGLSYALEGAAIGLRSYQPQVYINGAWRAFA